MLNKSSTPTTILSPNLGGPFSAGRIEFAFLDQRFTGQLRGGEVFSRCVGGKESAKLQLDSMVCKIPVASESKRCGPEDKLYPTVNTPYFCSRLGMAVKQAIAIRYPVRALASVTWHTTGWVAL
jgi:hypothetical protein